MALVSDANMAFDSRGRILAPKSHSKTYQINIQHRIQNPISATRERRKSSTSDTRGQSGSNIDRMTTETQQVYHTTLGRDPRQSKLPFPTIPDPVFNASSIPELSPHNIIEGPADFPSICPLNVDITPVVPLTPRPPVSIPRTRYRNSTLAIAAKTSSSAVRTPATSASATMTVKRKRSREMHKLDGENIDNMPAKLPETTGHDVFKPLPTKGIPSNIKPRNDHPVSKSKIVGPRR